MGLPLFYNNNINKITMQVYGLLLEYHGHGHETIQNLPNLVRPIKSDLHYRLLIISAIKTNPGLINLLFTKHRNTWNIFIKM